MAAFLSIGSNLGDRVAYLRAALDALIASDARVIRVSSFYETEPVGFVDQPWFLNIAAEVETCMAPRRFLDLCLEIERSFGRLREIRGGPRTIDLDILLYGTAVLDEPRLTIPHPRMAERRFVLAPLAEIAPDVLHPVLHKTVQALLDSCGDPAIVRRHITGGAN